MLLVLTMSGLAAAATLVDDTTPATLATFEDLDGNGIDDDCETAVTAAPDAVTAAMAAVDTDANGVISVPEAAHSDWVGGTNCNHGGYVSTVAGASADECDEAEAPEAPEGTTEDADEGSGDSEPTAIEASTDTLTAAADCAEATLDEVESETDDAAKAACEAGVVVDPTVLAAMTHVEIAQSELVGGKNCNHGGLVSESAKAQKAEKQAAREARQAAREAKLHLKAGKHKKGHSGQ